MTENGQEDRGGLTGELRASPRGRGRLLPPAAWAGLVLSLFLVALLFLVVSLSRERSTFRALLNPGQIFEEGADEQARLEARKLAILRSLNEDIDQETRGRAQEATRHLTRLDRLWRSVKSYLAPQESGPEPDDGREVLQARRPPQKRPGPFPAPAPATPEQIELEDLLQQIFSLLDESLVKPEGRQVRGKGKAVIPRSEPVVAAESAAVPAEPVSGGSRALDDLLYSLEPRGGVRTRGVAWRLHPNLTLEGTVDTTQMGQLDGDLSDFGIRSVHGLTFLRDVSRPLLMKGYEKIDSGYPRSYGIGLNLRLSSAMQMIFDYSHEYPSDHFIEYRGNWESSLLADYAKKRPESGEGDASTHNFFFGLRYLHRLNKATIPVHTGVFYSTNMADETLPSDVSMGFSLGGGYQRDALQMGLSYRLRIWENPDEAFLLTVSNEDIRTRVSNQLLFFVAF